MPPSFMELFAERVIHRVWDKLPASFTYNPEMAKYKICHVHHNPPTSQWHIDGPAPMVKNCSYVRKNKQSNKM